MCFLVLPFVAKTQSLNVTIDAEKDAFYESLIDNSDGLVYLPSDCHLTDVGSAPDDNYDLSAIAWFGYDYDYLYCYIEVYDDIVNVSNSERYLNDNVELKFERMTDIEITVPASTPLRAILNGV